MKKWIIFTVSMLLVASLCSAQNATIAPVAKQRFFDSNGAPLAGGKLCSFQAGTTTPLATYTDGTAGTPNSNPITLDGSGYAPNQIWLLPQTYKFILYSSVGADNNCPNAGASQWSADQLNGPSGPVILNPIADQNILAHNLLPANGNTTQSLGSAAAPWLGTFYTISITQSEASPQTNNVLYAGDGITRWAGADIGAQVNAAYAALPSTGGRIHINRSTAGTCYSFTTPVVIGTASKPAVLEGDPGGTCLLYTPSSLTAITFDTGQGQALGLGDGLRDIILKGSCAAQPCASGTAAGVQLGGSNGAMGAFFEASVIGNYTAGFQYGIVQGSAGGGFDVRLLHSFSMGNQYGFYNNLGAASTENLQGDGGCICGNATGVYLHGAGDYTFDKLSYDDNTVTAFDLSGNLFVKIKTSHFENSGQGLGQYLTAAGNTKAVVTDNVFKEARNGGITNPQFISWGADSLVVANNSYEVTGGGGTTVTQAVNPTSGSVVSTGNRIGTGITNPILSTWFTSGGNGWQCDSFPNSWGCFIQANLGLKLVTRYNGIPTVGLGVPSQVATIDLLAQNNNIGSTLIYSVPASGAGLYRASCEIIVTAVAATSSTLPACTIGWTDKDNSAVQSAALTATNGGNLTTTHGLAGADGSSAVINAKASTTINYSTTGYASNAANAMQYAIHIRLEAL